jgi:hypothetical protein
LNEMFVTLELFAVRTTEFSGKLWLKIHAAEQIGEARVRAQWMDHCSFAYSATPSLWFVHACIQVMRTFTAMKTDFQIANPA